MKHALLIVCLLAAGSVFAQAPDLSKLDVVERAVPAGPVAIVDKSVVSREEYLTAYRAQIAQLSAMAGADRVDDTIRARTGVTVLANLITEKVLLEEAYRRGISVTDAEVNAQYNKEIADLQANLVQESGEAVTEADLLQQSGQTKADLLESIRKGLLIQGVRTQLAKGVDTKVPEADIKKFYDARIDQFTRPGGVHIKQIYIRPEGGEAASPKSWEAAQKVADKALARIRAGEKFETVAADVSDSPDASRGGDLGMMPADSLPPFFHQAVSKLEPGELSNVVKSPQGFHIVHYVGTQDSEVMSLSNVHDKIKSLLERVKVEEAIENFTEPIATDPERVQVFLDLQQSLSALLDGPA
ncbi:MAG: hypothetical protein GC168_00805 [Candidatus Hydrogenedens sp.]|nr:hypothetical protein [Candidatus Hydrogenedens sp.]